MKLLIKVILHIEMCLSVISLGDLDKTSFSFEKIYYFIIEIWSRRMENYRDRQIEIS